jgi:catechol 2,3-dioxygenase-like lactoylglutathione lyase family enzyme
MGSKNKSYVEHVAIRVKDVQWHILFFHEVLGMTIREVDGSADSPRQVWTVGGMQLMADSGFAGPEGRLGHLGIMTDDLEFALQRAQAWGVKELPQGRNWLALPDGLVIELIQASGNSVTEALAVKPRA